MLPETRIRQVMISRNCSYRQACRLLGRNGGRKAGQTRRQQSQDRSRWEQYRSQREDLYK